jgi:hypothetical protein
MYVRSEIIFLYACKRDRRAAQQGIGVSFGTFLLVVPVIENEQSAGSSERLRRALRRAIPPRL